MIRRSARLLSAAVIISSFSGASASPPQAAAPETVPPPDAVAIRVVPERVHSGVKVRLELAGVKPSVVRWETDGGILHWDDTKRVDWRAPTRGGEVLVRVVFKADDREQTLQRRIPVHEPSTDGMVWIPKGSFIRGDLRGTNDLKEIKTDQNRNDEPFHTVYLDGYWIDRHPVTNRQYAEFLREGLRQGMLEITPIAVMGEVDGGKVPLYYFKSYEDLIEDFYATRNARVPFFFHEISWDGSTFTVQESVEEHPVVDVSWFGAEAYARFYGKRLPTEAQWERAARGNDGRTYPWGNNLPTVYHGNLNEAYGSAHTPIGRYSPLGDSPHGVADVLSSCFEWTNDWFNIDYYADYSGTEPLRNPEGPFWGLSHTIRGAPGGLRYRYRSIDPIEPLSQRYSWRFEFLLGDSFANGNTSFRTVIWDSEAPPSGPPTTPSTVRAAAERSPKATSTKDADGDESAGRNSR